MKKGFLFPENKNLPSILLNILTAFFALAINGFGAHLTILANIGAAPWDVLNLGISKALGILYGTASIVVSLIILVIDILLREPIGIAMIIDAFTVGKSVDLFSYLGFVPKPHNIIDSLLMLTVGLFIIGYTQYFYMMAALGCGPRDTLIVGIAKRIPKVPLGILVIGLQSAVTLTGWLLGGKVGVGTIACAFGSGPIMQLAFDSMNFNATKLRHQRISESLKAMFGKKTE